MTRASRLEPRVVGSPLAYAAERLWPAPNSVVTAASVYEDYVAWCMRSKRLALREGVFRETLQNIARACGLAVCIDGTSIVYADTRVGARR